MKQDKNNSKTNTDNAPENNDDFPGYPPYPAGEDIYNNSKEVDLPSGSKIEINPTVERVDKLNEKNFNEDKSGGDLDIPGAELDDQEERIGSEDEENNYYSLGGDNHENLEEDKGD